MKSRRGPLVFISYSTEDLAFAELVRRAIENLGFCAFLADSSLNPGDSLSEIPKRIRQAMLFVLLWSQSSSQSEWVRDESGAAWGAKVPVLPVLLSPGVPLPPSLRSSGVKYLKAVDRDADSILRVQAAVITWWHKLLAKHHEQLAALEEARRRRQAESTKTLLGVAAAGAIIYALSKNDQ